MRPKKRMRNERAVLSKGFRDNLSSWFELSARHEGDLEITTWFPIRSDLCGPDGGLRLGAVAFAVDSAVGMSAGFSSLPNWVVTTDIDLRLFGEAKVGPLRTHGRTLRAGRSQVLAEAWITDVGQGDLLVGYATANHGSLTPENGAPLEVFPVGEVLQQESDWTGPRPPMDEWFGARVVGAGVAELEMVDNARNPWGILHGALHTLLAEEATRSLVDGRVVSATLRFMAPVRVGPAQATAKIIAGDGDRVTARVEVRDVGNDGRLGSLAVLTVDPSRAVA